MQIDPRHLKLLNAVVRAGSFSAAADLLNMSQPSVSVAIQQLEARVGKPVVIRDRKGVRLTEHGEILMRHALALEKVLADAASEVQHKQSGVSGPLRLGGTPGALLAMVPRIVSELQSSAGPCDISVIDVSDTEIPKALQQRAIEIAFCTEAAPDPAIEDIPMRSEAFVLVAAPGIFSAQRVRLQDAAKHPWILPRQEGETRRRLEAIFLNADVPLPKNVVRCDLLATQKEILRQGKAVALLPHTVVQAELEAGYLSATSLENGPPPRRLIARKLKDHALSPLAQRALSLGCGIAGDEL